MEQLPRPKPSVAQALATTPLSFGLRDMRADPSAVGVDQDSGWIVRTSDNVGQYCTDRMGEMLVHAGARLSPSPAVALETELIDYQVIEGGTFVGTVRIRTLVRRGAAEPWSKTYVGNSKRWGRTHSPENFNEALSNALADAAQQLMNDEEFATALVGRSGARAGSSGG